MSKNLSLPSQILLLKRYNQDFLFPSALSKWQMKGHGNKTQDLIAVKPCGWCDYYYSSKYKKVSHSLEIKCLLLIHQVSFKIELRDPCESSYLGCRYNQLELRLIIIWFFLFLSSLILCGRNINSSLFVASYRKGKTKKMACELTLARNVISIYIRKEGYQIQNLWKFYRLSK